jgi:hypothetical protein
MEKPCVYVGFCPFFVHCFRCYTLFSSSWVGNGKGQQVAPADKDTKAAHQVTSHDAPQQKENSVYDEEMESA